ncbi:unnamed protein product [Brassica oleracea var. botrytis]
MRVISCFGDLSKCFLVNLRLLNNKFHCLQVDRKCLRDVAGTRQSISSIKSHGRSDIFNVFFLIIVSLKMVA